MRSEKEKTFQRKLIAHFEKRAAENGPNSTSARLLEMARAKLAKDEKAEAA